MRKIWFVFLGNKLYIFIRSLGESSYRNDVVVEESSIKTCNDKYFYANRRCQTCSAVISNSDISAFITIRLLYSLFAQEVD